MAQAGRSDTGLGAQERHVYKPPQENSKSPCYSLLSAVFDEVHRLPGSSVVILESPLIALMQGQVRAMAERNIHMVYVGDADDDVTIDEVCAHRQSDQTSIQTKWGK